MKNIDIHDLDGNILRTFLVILEESSVSKAAIRLNVTQSAVSYSLARLRRVLGDPLFVRSGQGLTPTETALSLKEPIQDVLDGLSGLRHQRPFDPRTEDMRFVIAANDLQRDLLLPSLFESLEAQLADIRMTVVPSLLPGPALLRENRCDLLISPRPPEGVDIVQKRLLTDHYMVFFDPEMRAAPANADDYMSARHITVRYGNNRTLEFDDMLENQGIDRNIVLRVPNFTAIAEFLRGSQMIATLPSLLQQHALRDFARVPMPLDTLAAGTIDLPIYMCWHQRYQHDPSHRWLRSQLEDVVAAKLRTPSNRPLSQQTG